MTPEGKVKAVVDKLLKEAGAYYLKPVQNGMGAPGLDYHGCHKGFAFAIETKAAGCKPTARQLNTCRHMINAGATVFVIDGDLTELFNWLHLPVPGYTNSLLKRYLSALETNLTPSPESD